LRRTSLSSVSSATSDNNSTSTGLSDHEFCCCNDETPARDEKNDKAGGTAAAEQTHECEHVSGSSSMRLSGLKVYRTSQLACYGIIDGLNKGGRHVRAYDSHQFLPSGGKPTKQMLKEPSDISMSRGANVQ
jgi:hypothetical protein